MGAAQSQQRKERPRKHKNVAEPEIIRISRTDPDLEEAIQAYASVGLNGGIVERIVQQQGMDPEEQKTEASKLSEELAKQREENGQLRRRMEELERNQQAETLTAALTAPTTVRTTQEESVPSEEEIIETKRRHFNETANRVEQVFLSKQQPNACAENENAIIECLAKNQKQVLLCRQHLDPYKACIGQSKSKLIQDQLGTTAVQ